MKKDSKDFRLEDYQDAWDKKRALESRNWEPLLTDDLLKQVFASGSYTEYAEASEGNTCEAQRPKAAARGSQRRFLHKEADARHPYPLGRWRIAASAAALMAVGATLWAVIDIPAIDWQQQYNSATMEIAQATTQDSPFNESSLQDDPPSRNATPAAQTVKHSSRNVTSSPQITAIYSPDAASASSDMVAHTSAEGSAASVQEAGQQATPSKVAEAARTSIATHAAASSRQVSIYAKSFDARQVRNGEDAAGYHDIMCNTGNSCDAEAIMNLLAASPQKGGRV